MKAQFTRILVIVTAILIFSDCKKFAKTMDCYFYTGTEGSGGTLSLYVDNNYKGELPNLKVQNSCNNDTIKQNALFLKLHSGKYKFIAKDKQGNIKSSGTLRFKTNSLHSSSDLGGQAACISGGCLIVGFSY